MNMEKVSSDRAAEPNDAVSIPPKREQNVREEQANKPRSTQTTARNTVGDIVPASERALELPH